MGSCVGLERNSHASGNVAVHESCSPYKVFSIFFPIDSPDIARISFLKLRKMKVKSISRVRLFATPWTVACTRLLHPWDYVAKSTGVGCHFLLQGIFPTQGSNPGLPHCRQTLYHPSHSSTDTGSESHTHNSLAPTSKMSYHGKNLGKPECTIVMRSPIQEHTT